jgi:hypothetical protein
MALLPIQSSDISYSQIYSPSVSMEQAHASGASSSLHAMFLVIPVVLVLGILWYRKYRIHQCMLNQQRAMLERMWQLRSTK